MPAMQLTSGGVGIGGGSGAGSLQRPKRDLTATFARFRSDGLARRGLASQPGQRLLGGEEDTRTSFSSSDVAVEMSSLPPSWIGSAEEAREDLRALKDKLALLEKAQQKRLRKVFTDDGSPDKEVEAMSQQIATLVRRVEQQIHQVKNRGASSGQSGADREHRQNVQRHLATQLQQLSQAFRQSQKDYLQEIRKRQKGTFWEEAPVGTKGTADVGFSDSHLLELESMETNSTQRSEEICQIAKSVSDLHTIFKELAVLVIDQGSILDRIDYNIEQVVTQSAEANAQLQKAEKSQKSNRALKCIIFLVVVNMVLLLILILRSRH